MWVGHVQITTLLIERAADVNLADFTGMTPLHIAAQHSGTVTAGILIQHGAIKTLLDDANKTALDYACTPGVQLVIRSNGTLFS